MKKEAEGDNRALTQKASIIQGALKLASGSGITIGGFLAAASIDMVGEETARFAIAVFAAITTAALSVALAFALRAK